MKGEYFERGVPGDQLGDHALACDGPPHFVAFLVVENLAVQFALKIHDSVGRQLQVTLDYLAYCLGNCKYKSLPIV